uniref:Glutathione peroxidase n=1 Tax=Leptobrachium leishanense TaxID=445787 RepID=A0A8C5R7U5_9ANUR
MIPAVLLLLLLLLPESLQKDKDFYTFKVVNIRGKLVSLEKYRGSVSLAVNVASQCGYTDGHYKALQQLQRDLGSSHFNVLAFPCNQFGHQEPDGDREIESFIRRNYSVTFPMFSKIAVSGTGANAAFKYLIGAEQSSLEGPSRSSQPNGLKRHFFSHKLDCDNQPQDPDRLFQRCFLATVTTINVQGPS